VTEPEVAIVCTGNKRIAHREKVIDRLRLVRGQWCVYHRGHGASPGGSAVPLDRLCAATGWQSPGIYPLKCGRCGRDTRPSPATLARALDAVAALGGHCLDLRHLPF